MSPTLRGLHSSPTPAVPLFVGQRGCTHPWLMQLPHLPLPTAPRFPRWTQAHYLFLRSIHLEAGSGDGMCAAGLGDIIGGVERVLM